MITASCSSFPGCVEVNVSGRRMILTAYEAKALGVAIAQRSEEIALALIEGGILADDLAAPDAVAHRVKAVIREVR